MGENVTHLNNEHARNNAATKPDSEDKSEPPASSLLSPLSSVLDSISSSAGPSSASSSASPSPPPATLGPSPVIIPSSSFTPTLSPIPSNAPVNLPPTNLPALAGGVPSKPRSRSNSTLHSSRPAPASPVPSRPPSQLINHSPGTRDRAGSGTSLSSSQRGSALASAPSSSSITPGSATSTSGSAHGLPPPTGLGLTNRRASLSGSSSSGLRSVSLSRPRNRSSLGATFVVPPAPLTPPLSSHPSGPSESSINKAEDVESNNTPIVPPPITPTNPISRKSRIIVRDYAFEPPDQRHFGLGPDRSLSNWGDATPPPPPPPETPNESKKQPSWTGFGLFGLRGYLTKRRGSGRDGNGSDGSGGRSGGMGSSNDDHEDEFNNNGIDDYNLPVPDHDDDDYAFYSGSEIDENDEPFGLFRAAYAFEAEGENELDLSEGDIVDVRGRGVGDGWVVAVKIGEGNLPQGKEGLVPEGYLERYYHLASDGVDSGLGGCGGEDSRLGSSVGLSGPIDSELSLRTEHRSVDIVVDEHCGDNRGETR